MEFESQIYMDHAASTPCEGRVVEAMLPYLTQCPGNPSNRNHRFGWQAAQAVERAREQVGAMLGADAGTIVFTSGSTESNNLAIKGSASALGKPIGEARRGHIITSATEHKAVLDPCQSLSREGFDVTFLEPGADGVIKAEMVKNELRHDTILVSVMWANNETGVINEALEIGEVCREACVSFHTDATQWAGKMRVDLRTDPVVLLSLSGHKIYGPKGVGALYIRDCVQTRDLRCQNEGGGQERGFRAGTLNVAGIVGLGEACEICQNVMEDEAPKLEALRDRLEKGLTAKLDGVHVNGADARRLPHTSSLSFDHTDGEALMMVATDIACSAASACSSMAITPSHVLTAMGVPEDLALATLRLSLGRSTTAADVDYAIEHIATAVKNLRALAPMLGLA